MNPDPIAPSAFDITEVRILLHDDRVYLYVLLGVNALGRVGGWRRRVIEPLDVLKALHEDLQAYSENGAMGDDWERGYPHGPGGGGQYKNKHKENAYGK